ncbi:aldehyde dehydrogenase family protein, partial [Klebsiella pneumoniae]
IESEAKPFEAQIHAWLDKTWQAAPIIGGHSYYESMIKADHSAEPVTAPYDRRIQIGQVFHANLDHVSAAIDSAQQAFATWNALDAKERASKLDALADLLE